MIETNKAAEVENQVAKAETKTPTINIEKFETSVSNLMVITVEGKEGRVYKFEMPFNAPLAECHMAGINVLQKIKEVYDDIVAKQKASTDSKVDDK